MHFPINNSIWLSILPLEEFPSLDPWFNINLAYVLKTVRPDLVASVRISRKSCKHCWTAFMFSQSIAIKITKGAYTLTTVCDKSLPPTVCRREATVESGCNNFWSSVYSRLLFCSFASMLRVYKMAQLTTQWQASPHPPPPFIYTPDTTQFEMVCENTTIEFPFISRWRRANSRGTAKERT